MSRFRTRGLEESGGHGKLFGLGRPTGGRATLRDRMNDCGFELATMEGMICEDCAYRDPAPTTVGLCLVWPEFKPDQVDEGICPRYKKG